MKWNKKNAISDRLSKNRVHISWDILYCGFVSVCVTESSEKQNHDDGFVQDCSNSIANALEILQSCTKPSIWYYFVLWNGIKNAISDRLSQNRVHISWDILYCGFVSVCVTESSEKQNHDDGFVQDCSNSIANALEILQSCTKPSIWYYFVLWNGIKNAISDRLWLRHDTDWLTHYWGSVLGIHRLPVISKFNGPVKQSLTRLSLLSAWLSFRTNRRVTGETWRLTAHETSP